MQPDTDIVLKIIRRVFPQNDEREILVLLQKYGVEEHETGQDRVYLAILKLCDEEKLTDPSHYVNIAKQDFRDVLAWAEYPNQMKFGYTKDPVKTAELIKKDQEQYQAWLNKAKGC
jgi:hypothetical protein